MIEAFRQQQPAALLEARMFVEELARIASLWNEQWLHTLQEVQVCVKYDSSMDHAVFSIAFVSGTTLPSVASLFLAGSVL